MPRRNSNLRLRCFRQCGRRIVLGSASTHRRHRAVLFRHGQDPAFVGIDPSAGREEAPLISCVMPTRGHVFPARFAIEAFRRQSYPNRELVVVCRAPGSGVADYLESLGDPAIRLYETPDADTVGDLRNRALAHCRGSLVCVWDDDDLYARTRLVDQLAALLAFGSPACFLQREILWWPAARRLAVSKDSIWENSMLARREAVPDYPHLDRGEDTALVRQLFAAGNGILLDAPGNYIRVYHGGNSWDASHFERFFDSASLAVSQEDYDRRFERMAAVHPMRAYRDGLETIRDTSVGQ